MKRTLVVYVFCILCTYNKFELLKVLLNKPHVNKYHGRVVLQLFCHIIQGWTLICWKKWYEKLKKEARFSLLHVICFENENWQEVLKNLLCEVLLAALWCKCLCDRIFLCDMLKITNKLILLLYRYKINLVLLYVISMIVSEPSNLY